MAVGILRLRHTAMLGLTTLHMTRKQIHCLSRMHVAHEHMREAMGACKTQVVHRKRLLSMLVQSAAYRFSWGFSIRNGMKNNCFDCVGHRIGVDMSDEFVTLNRAKHDYNRADGALQRIFGGSEVERDARDLHTVTR